MNSKRNLSALLLAGVAIAGLVQSSGSAQQPPYPPPEMQYPPPSAQQPAYAPPAVPVDPPVVNHAAAGGAADTFSGGWLAGAGVYYLVPRWDSNPAYSSMVVATPNVVATTQTTNQQDFSMNGQFAPVVWLGWVSDSGVGMRARWWHLQGSSDTSVNMPASDPAATTVYSAYPVGVGFSADSDPALNNNLTFSSSLTMDVTDLELLWDVRGPRGSLLLGAGVRYAHLGQTYGGTWASTPADPTSGIDTVNTALSSSHNFDGVGPVVSAEGRYPLGTTGIALLGNARGSLLFGTGRQWAILNSIETNPAGYIDLQTVTSQSQSLGGALPVFEFEVGAEWGQQFGAYRLALQAEFVAQAWFDAGNASNQQTILGSVFPSNNNQNYDTLTLVGFQLSLALTY